MQSLLIVGAGPAGLSAAINAASEGLDVTVLDKADHLGGQFEASHDIENFPGVPKTTGKALAGFMVKQAKQFGVKFRCPVEAIKLTRDPDNYPSVLTDTLQSYTADAVLLALGLQPRRLDNPDLDALVGSGVSYGRDWRGVTGDGPVVILGAGNSAGQEAVALAATRNVYLVCRRPLAETMSAYLVEEIAAQSRIVVLDHHEVTEPRTDKAGQLKSLDLHPIGAYRGSSIQTNLLEVFIGGNPHTGWLQSAGILDDAGFIVTPHDHATTIPGVFAVGDARLGSCKRIAAAVGEGSTAVPEIHHYLSTLK